MPFSYASVVETEQLSSRLRRIVLHVGVYFSDADDVVLHPQGPGTEWAAAASPADRVALDHARSWYRPALDSEWQLLVSDLSGLPATARILEELPREVEAIVIIEVAAADDLDYLPGHPRATLMPRIGTGNGHRPSTLAHAVREPKLPTGRPRFPRCDVFDVPVAKQGFFTHAHNMFPGLRRAPRPF